MISIYQQAWNNEMFIKDSLLDLLNELSGAQESIEKVSVWIQQYRDQAPVIAQAWKSYYIEGMI